MARTRSSKKDKDEKPPEVAEEAAPAEEAPKPELVVKQPAAPAQPKEKAAEKTSEEKVFKKKRRFVPNPDRMLTLKEFVRGLGPVGEAFRVTVKLAEKRVVKKTLAEWQEMFEKFKTQPR